MVGNVNYIDGLAILIWIISVFFFVRSMYHWWKMVGCSRSKTHEFVAAFFNFLTPFLPGFYSEEGYNHRRQYLKNLGIALILFAVFVVLVGVVRHKI